jgi:hypothetical protein
VAHTYSYIPDSLGPIIEGIVADCSEALLSEIGFAINYKADSFLRIMSELQQEVLTTPIRYPIFALIQPYKAKLGDFTHQEIICDLIICALTKAEYSWQEREDETFTPILLPIYAEFMERLKFSSSISYDGRNPEHNVVKLYHMGDTQANKNGYIVPDTVDCVLIEGLKFNLERDTLTCTPTPCEPVHELSFLEYISSYSVSGNGTSDLVVGISGTVFISLLPGGPVEYTINYGLGAADEVIEVLTPLTFSFNGVANGTYIGIIKSSYGSQVEFEYTVTNNVLAGIVYTPSIGVDYGELDCQDNANYPIGLTFRGLSTTLPIDSASILVSDGTYIFDEVIASLDATRSYTDYRLTDLSESFDIQIETRSHNILNNKINLQIKTI